MLLVSASDVCVCLCASLICYISLVNLFKYILGEYILGEYILGEYILGAFAFWYICFV